MKYFILLFSLSAVTLGAEETVSFNKQIRPILADRCYHCHGPDAAEGQKGALRLDDESSAKADLYALKRKKRGKAALPADEASKKARYAIVEGDLEHSTLIERIFSDDEDEMMPPADSDLRLSKEEKDLLKRWIQQGAKWEKHWAYVSPQKAVVKKSKNSINAIDDYIANQLRLEKLSPSQAANKEKIIRRLSLDLRGIPPSLKEVDSFLVDKSSKAYERVVDDFLASQHYGERMALEWLDLARYGDTRGLFEDSSHPIWPWRDWVVKAFNNNQPFDDFIREQLAGDLLENPTDEQILATGFNRNNPTSKEGGIIDEEYLKIYAADRVKTTSITFLGMSLECAQCHDHKYDPLSQKEFYEMSAFFTNIAEKGKVDDKHAPAMKVYTKEYVDGEKSLVEKVALYESKLKGEDGIRPELKYKKQVPAIEKVSLIRITSNSKNRPLYLDEVQVFSMGKNLAPLAKASQSTTMKKQSADKAIDGIYLEDKKGAHYSATNKEKNSSWELALAEESAIESLILWPADNLPRDLNIKIELLDKQKKVVKEYKKSLKPKQVLLFGAIEQGIFSAELNALLMTDFPESKRAQALYRIELLKENTATKNDAMALVKNRNDLVAWRKNIPVSMIMKEREGEARKVHILDRGDYTAKKEEVFPHVPRAILSFEGFEKNRLGLADWIVDKGNPLTSRVTINRYWQLIFGRGIVRTTEDFGLQGELPSNPELLDYLAVEFIESGWDLKHMIKLMVMSATYRQTTVVSPIKRKTDPENIHLSYASRQRLQAELIRDNSLAISGLLNTKIGGAPVRVYQPPGLWKEKTTKMPFVQDKGDKLYRKTLYAFWRRTSPHPSSVLFDATDRTTCAARRAQTNTPLQALVLLNDVQHVESARILAERMMVEGGESLADKLSFAWRLATARQPSKTELAVLSKEYELRVKEFTAQKEEAKKLVSAGDYKQNVKLNNVEQAAYMIVAQMILNLDETITRN
ncbi:PSD1 and planctomycete cytochrome C domain-containing protein [Lentisphaera profundi]|uniref:PSD1 and planctomycete cytochrome C domain-containing protein n=1 Tax=Lentisphaera profundi TaxID=1658616 RepID=A0ABY7VR34_9BACT|nr:PSD1 and planctomycete cytochrome C domain-containing protein [Lentisphaera profundi]WDE96663.1 PSD1 and planctomycete cytochrome C domain-containing protein [Lentisphaera profundi]